jgi:hypothetical protein
VKTIRIVWARQEGAARQGKGRTKVDPSAGIGISRNLRPVFALAQQGLLSVKAYPEFRGQVTAPS